MASRGITAHGIHYFSRCCIRPYVIDFVDADVIKGKVEYTVLKIPQPLAWCAKPPDIGEASAAIVNTRITGFSGSEHTYHTIAWWSL